MNEAGPTQRFIGGALMAVGGLLTALSGTCTALGLVVGLGSAEYTTHALLIGALPIAAGLGLYFSGKALRGKRAATPGSPPAELSDGNGDTL